MYDVCEQRGKYQDEDQDEFDDMMGANDSDDALIDGIKGLMWSLVPRYCTICLDRDRECRSVPRLFGYVNRLQKPASLIGCSSADKRQRFNNEPNVLIE